MSQSTFTYGENKSYLFDSHLHMDSYPMQTLPSLVSAQEDHVRSHGVEHITSFSSFPVFVSDENAEIEQLNIRSDFIERSPTLQLEYWYSDETMISPAPRLAKEGVIQQVDCLSAPKKTLAKILPTR